MPKSLGFTYPGSKHQDGSFHAIINHIRPHTLFIEPFAGSMAISLRKRRALQTIGIEKSPETFHRLRACKDYQDFDLFHNDGMQWIKDNWQLVTGNRIKICLYFDPPYVMESRSQQRKLYDVEWSRDDHEKFLDLVMVLNTFADCDLLISGYFSTLYDECLTKKDGWYHITYETRTRSSNPLLMHELEYLWMNYNPDEITELHDYQYVGEDFRERENLARQKKRWISRLQKMPVLQRNHMLQAIKQEFMSNGSI